jgi:tetratricopeptide (TPR) repeat protein
MTTKRTVPSKLIPFFRDHKTLLWVTQRYDLIDGAAPHDYEAPASEISYLYRESPSEADGRIAMRFWRAAWFEGAKSPVLSAIRSQVQDSSYDNVRNVILVASEADAGASFSSASFVPAFVLSGLLGEEVPPASRYGELGKRSRERLSWLLACRLERYQRHLLVVVGARTDSDLERLSEVLTERPIMDLDILLITDGSDVTFPRSISPGVNVQVWSGSEDEFFEEMSSYGLPSAAEPPKYSIRVGAQTVVTLTETTVDAIGSICRLLTNHDLTEPESFTLDDLNDFFHGDIDNWKGYAAGACIRRSIPNRSRDIVDEIVEVLSDFRQSKTAPSSKYYQVPCDDGSGATTYVRHVAFQVASKGFPTLVFRPDAEQIDIDTIVSFTTLVQDAIQKQTSERFVPFLLVLDAEHSKNINVGQLLQSLASSGRSVVALHARPLSLYGSLNQLRTARKIVLEPLTATASNDEVTECCRSFSSLFQQWCLPIAIPRLEQWRNYQQAVVWIDDNTHESSSLFWVALRFFVVDGADFASATSMLDALGSWISKQQSKVDDTRLEEVLRHVAVLSAFRISCPLWTAFRPVFGERFPAQFAGTVKALSSLVEWLPPREPVRDNRLRFRHPAFAIEYLRRADIANEEARLLSLGSLVESLSVGSSDDAFVADMLAAHVLGPSFDDHVDRTILTKLSIFDRFPSELAENSKTVLHHWSRCLYQSAEERNQPHIDDDERLQLLNRAVEKIELAIDLPERPDREEHPSHLYNTAGTAMARLAMFLEKVGESDQSNTAWEVACDDFKRSLNLSGNTNVDAMLGFSHRLLRHAQPTESLSGDLSSEQLSDVADALGLLDDAEEVLNDHPDPQSGWRDQLQAYKTRAFSILDPDRAAELIGHLKGSDQAELGYFCEAQMILYRELGSKGLGRALEVMDEFDRSGAVPSERILLLWLSLLRRHENKKPDFALERKLRLQLEKTESYSDRPIDQFRHAVLCYQIGQYREGADRFKRLREMRRLQGSPQLRVRDIWKDPNNPEHPKVTSVRLTRFISDFRGEGYVDGIQQTVPVRPKSFSPPLKMNHMAECIIRFTAQGPLAIPKRHWEHEDPSQEAAEH